MTAAVPPYGSTDYASRHDVPHCGCGTPLETSAAACGASLVTRVCAACRRELSPQARFCHRCGQPVRGSGPASRRVGTQGLDCCRALCVLLVGGIVYRCRPASPPAGRTGHGQRRSQFGTLPGQRRARTSVSMSPRERFDRLFNRIMQAAEQRRFSPGATIYADGPGRLRSAGHASTPMPAIMRQ